MSATSKILVGLAAYIMIGAAVLGYNDGQRFNLCDPFYEPGYLRGKCYEKNAYESVLSGMFWPITVPLQIGAQIGNRRA